MQGYLIVFLGAGIGGAFRHGVNVWSARIFGLKFPQRQCGRQNRGLAGDGFDRRLFHGERKRRPAPAAVSRDGHLGGFTTLSSVSLDVALLHERGELVIFAFYVVFASAAALFSGLCAPRSFIS